MPHSLREREREKEKSPEKIGVQTHTERECEQENFLLTQFFECEIKENDGTKNSTTTFGSLSVCMYIVEKIK